MIWVGTWSVLLEKIMEEWNPAALGIDQLCALALRVILLQEVKQSCSAWGKGESALITPTSLIYMVSVPAWSADSSAFTHVTPGVKPAAKHLDILKQFLQVTQFFNRIIRIMFHSHNLHWLISTIKCKILVIRWQRNPLHIVKLSWCTSDKSTSALIHLLWKDISLWPFSWKCCSHEMPHWHWCSWCVMRLLRKWDEN